MTLSTAVTTGTPARGPLTGLAVQFVLLAVLGATQGVTTLGVIAGGLYGLVLCGLLASGLQRAGMTALGPANAVTLARAILVGGVTALVVTSFSHAISIPALVTVAGVALALDGVDGQVARRTGSSSALGARFDMEIDAYLILVLSIYAGDRFGWWTVALGAYRYLFVAASWAFPWLNAALPPKFSRKVVAALQGVVLALVTAHLLPHYVALGALILALGTLTWSFGRDTLWLYRESRVPERWSAARRALAPVS